MVWDWPSRRQIDASSIPGAFLGFSWTTHILMDASDSWRTDGQSCQACFHSGLLMVHLRCQPEVPLWVKSLPFWVRSSRITRGFPMRFFTKRQIFFPSGLIINYLRDGSMLGLFLLKKDFVSALCKGTWYSGQKCPPRSEDAFIEKVRTWEDREKTSSCILTCPYEEWGRPHASSQRRTSSVLTNFWSL